MCERQTYNRSTLCSRHITLFESETESKIIQFPAIMGINGSKQNSRITPSAFNVPDDETTIYTSAISFETALKPIGNPIITNKLLVIGLDANVSNTDDVYQKFNQSSSTYYKFIPFTSFLPMKKNKFFLISNPINQ
jgi:hypothetical protein